MDATATAVCGILIVMKRVQRSLDAAQGKCAANQQTNAVNQKHVTLMYAAVLLTTDAAVHLTAQIIVKMAKCAQMENV